MYGWWVKAYWQPNKNQNQTKIQCEEVLQQWNFKPFHSYIANVLCHPSNPLAIPFPNQMTPPTTLECQHAISLTAQPGNQIRPNMAGHQLRSVIHLISCASLQLTYCYSFSILVFQVESESCVRKGFGIRLFVILTMARGFNYHDLVFAKSGGSING